jgi:hypothetical protein
MGADGFGASLGLSDLGAYLGAYLGASTVLGFSACFGVYGFSAGLGGEDEAAGLGASGSTSKRGLPTPRLSPLLT